MRMTDRRRWLLLAVLCGLVSGCATDRPQRGLEWVEEQSAERARLEAQGFPQFTGVN